jgi:Lon protease-like protein
MPQPWLPLFPLQVVLLPGNLLPLHIFEERYKEMISEALENKTEFGVVLARQKGIVNAGCTAGIQQVLNRYDDGKLDILTMGYRRFEIMLLNDEKDYIRGQVEYFDDEDSEPTAMTDRLRVLEDFQTLRAISSEQVLVEPDVADPQLTFRISQLVPDLNFRQTLLQMRSEGERLRHLRSFLEDYTARQREIHHVRQVAPLNGHARWPGSINEPA